MSREFFQLYLLAMGYSFYGFFIMGYFKAFGLTEINNDALITWIGSVGSIFTGLGRLLSSTLLDHFSFHSVFGTLVLL